MDHLPTQTPVTPEIVDSPRVVDAELVGYELPPPLWRRLLGRAVLSLVLGGLGLGVIVIGVVLTITIIGAVVGVPLIIFGLVLCLFAFLAPFARGEGRFTVVRWPR